MRRTDEFNPRKSRLRERGQAAVEFALVMPILLTVVFAAIEFGSAYWTYQQLSAAASEGARKAIVSRGDPSRVTTVTDATRDAAPNLTASSMTVIVTSTWAAGSDVTVTARYPEEIRIMGITFFDQELESTRTMRVEQ